jgi:hypothetical protein
MRVHERAMAMRVRMRELAARVQAAEGRHGLRVIIAAGDIVRAPA